MKISTLIALGLACTTAAAFAQGDDGDKTFSQLDQDQDYLISPTEAEADADVLSQFTQLDKDANGYIDPQEFSALDRGDRDYE